MSEENNTPIKKKKRPSTKTHLTPQNLEDPITVRDPNIPVRHYSLEKQKLVIKYIEEGMSQRDACLLAKVSPISFSEWLEDNPAFKVEIACAESSFKLVHVRNIVEHALANKDWKASLALLGRKFPSEWGQGQLAAAAQTTNNIQINNNAHAINQESIVGLLKQLTAMSTPIISKEEDEDDDASD
jgi:hypothetical protein